MCIYLTLSFAVDLSRAKLRQICFYYFRNPERAFVKLPLSSNVLLPAPWKASPNGLHLYQTQKIPCSSVVTPPHINSLKGRQWLRSSGDPAAKTIRTQNQVLQPEWTCCSIWWETKAQNRRIVEREHTCHLPFLPMFMLFPTIIIVNELAT